MAEEGVLTPHQADMLRDSLDGANGGESGGPRRPWARWIGWGALVYIVALIVMLTGIGGEPGTVQDISQSLNPPGGHGEMNRTLTTVLAAGLLLVVPLLIWAYLHNSLIAKEEKVFEAWAQTESNFQRRADLVPALVEAVTRYLRHESETLTAVTRDRAQSAERLSVVVEEMIEAQKDFADILRDKGSRVIEDEKSLRSLFESQVMVGQGLGRVVAVAEAYPELRSSNQFLGLQAQLEGTENRINVARMRFNDSVRDYNATMRMLPWNLVSNLGSFQRKAYFRSEEEARNAPDLKMD